VLDETGQTNARRSAIESARAGDAERDILDTDDATGGPVIMVSR
jgi:hypothetical protein